MDVETHYAEVSTQETAGCMPSGRQMYHACTTALMCGLLVALMLLSGRFLLPISGFQASGALMAGAIFFEVVAVGGIFLQIRDYCRIVRQFSYDGKMLQFWTLGSSNSQKRDLNKIADIRQGRLHAPSIGFSVVFMDSKKVYLDYELPNARQAAERLRLDLHGRS